MRCAFRLKSAGLPSSLRSRSKNYKGSKLMSGNNATRQYLFPVPRERVAVRISPLAPFPISFRNNVYLSRHSSVPAKQRIQVNNRRTLLQIYIALFSREGLRFKPQPSKPNRLTALPGVSL